VEEDAREEGNFGAFVYGAKAVASTWTKFLKLLFPETVTWFGGNMELIPFSDR
jgi:hypothetical protein